MAKTGDWKPVAQRQFRNAIVVVALEVGEPDTRGPRSHPDVAVHVRRWPQADFGGSKDRPLMTLLREAWALWTLHLAARSVGSRPPAPLPNDGFASSAQSKGPMAFENRENEPADASGVRK
jgi:hypothetical protein